MKETISKSTNEKELKAEMTELSKSNPESWFTFRAVFGKVTIQQHDKKPSSNYGTQCYETFGGFFKNGMIVKASSSWVRQYNYIPCGDR